jgi:uncharacterized membrane protein YfcA
MEALLGFVIAVAIGLTGVGGGTITAPVLMLFLGMPAGMAVGTALVFGAVVKLVPPRCFYFAAACISGRSGFCSRAAFRV